MGRVHRKIDLNTVRESAEKHGFELLSEKYISNKEKLILKCKNGHITEKNLVNIENGKGCSECYGNRKKDINFAKEKFESCGFELLEKEYKNAKTPMRVKCENGHMTLKTLDSITGKVKGCTECKKPKKKTFEEIKERVELRGFKMISTEYESVKDKLEMICPKGHSSKISYESFIKSKTGCNECGVDLTKGENNYRFDRNKTYEERSFKRQNFEYKRWRQKVYEKNNFRCQKCRKVGKNLHAHHIENYSECKEKRYDVNNGVTLCKDCHFEFHRIYGRFNNNRKQIDEFLGGQ